MAALIELGLLSRKAKIYEKFKLLTSLGMSLDEDSLMTDWYRAVEKKKEKCHTEIT